MSSPFSVQHNVDLTTQNTMRLSCMANSVVKIHDQAGVEPAIANAKTISNIKEMPLFVLSGGSNVLLPSRLHACVVMPEMTGIDVVSESDEHIDIAVMAGENWHELVVKTVQKGWYGLENLALIPGKVGASPMQNIGAYGVELADFLTSVRAYHLPTDTWHTLTKAECKFAYRDSIFKRQAGEWLITQVNFRLHKDPTRTVMNYGDVQTKASDIAQQHHRQAPTPIDVMNAIINIRSTKLPNPEVLPNCGSFFKNPVIPTSQFKDLQRKFADIKGYPVDEELVNNSTKVAAGWLIDQAGLKGQGIEPIKTHVNQALVLVNHAPASQPATQADILATQDLIIATVFDKFGITLEREPVWVR